MATFENTIAGISVITEVVSTYTIKYIIGFFAIVITWQLLGVF